MVTDECPMKVDRALGADTSRDHEGRKGMPTLVEPNWLQLIRPGRTTRRDVRRRPALHSRCSALQSRAVMSGLLRLAPAPTWSTRNEPKPSCDAGFRPVKRARRDGI